MQSFFKNKKKFPTIIFYMDAPAIREELRVMCRKIAHNGYNVIFQIYFIDVVLKEIILLTKIIIKIKTKN